MKFSTHSAIFRWKPAAWLRVSGEDAASFLQGQFTNELRGLGSGQAVYGLWLNLKGKVVADSFVVAAVSGGEAAGAGGWREFWVGSYFSPAAVIRERLESHIIADDVTIEDCTAGWEGVSVFGETGITARFASEVRAGVVFTGRRGEQENAEWVFPTLPSENAGPGWTQCRGMRELDAMETERRRIVAGIPAVPADVGPGDLPNEGGLDVGAVSYTKGCYLGQEVMARLKSMGQVRRRLLRVAVEASEVPPLPAQLFTGERKIGELRSAVPDGAGGFVGLAMLSLLHLPLDGGLALAPGGTAVVQLRDRP